MDKSEKANLDFINRALEQNNIKWEKRFKSLEKASDDKEKRKEADPEDIPTQPGPRRPVLANIVRKPPQQTKENQKH